MLWTIPERRDHKRSRKLQAWNQLGAALLVISSLLTIKSVAATPIETESIGQKAFVDAQAYENGELGRHPERLFQSTSATSALINVVRWHEDCALDGYVFLSPQADEQPGHHVYMLDSKGHLVWYHEEWGAIKNVRVQHYKGREYITYWIGDDGYWSHGSGFYKMVFSPSQNASTILVNLTWYLARPQLCSSIHATGRQWP